MLLMHDTQRETDVREVHLLTPPFLSISGSTLIVFVVVVV